MFGIDHALYSMVAYFINAKTMDIVATGLTDLKECRIIGDNLTEIAKEIYERTGRTATITDGRGLASGKGKDILFVVVTRLEVGEIRTIVKEDDSAFMTVYDVLEVVGTHVKKTRPEVIKRIEKKLKEQAHKPIK